MQDEKYTLRYLPIFYDDLSEVVDYISNRLHSKQAALSLLNTVEKAIFDRLPVAEAFERYPSMKERRYPYYRIYVKNFIVFYVVIKDEVSVPIMEVRRFLYNKKNYKEYI